LAAILLISLLFFNWIGYRVLMQWMEQKADARLEARLDNNNYNESDLITIKISLNMPYQNEWSDFERYDGEVEKDGKIYKYVKRKVQNDSLILLCIPHETKMNLQAAKDDFYKLVNDLQQNNSSKKGNDKKTAFKNLLSEYVQDIKTWSFNVNPDLSLHYFIENNSSNSTGFYLLPGQPPDC
jgi:hypothetical protein